MRISVTHDHIREGAKGVPKCCPIALAMQAGGFCDPSVGTVSVKFSSGGGKCVAQLPAEAMRFIDRFDASRSVEPFEFDLNVD